MHLLSLWNTKLLCIFDETILWFIFQAIEETLKHSRNQRWPFKQPWFYLPRLTPFIRNLLWIWATIHSQAIVGSKSQSNEDLTYNFKGKKAVLPSGTEQYCKTADDTVYKSNLLYTWRLIFLVCVVSSAAQPYINTVIGKIGHPALSQRTDCIYLCFLWICILCPILRSFQILFFMLFLRIFFCCLLQLDLEVKHHYTQY